MNARTHILDRLARPVIIAGRRRLPAFQVCGCTGVVAGFTLAMALAGKAGLSYSVMGAIAVSAILTFLLIVATSKILTGEEQIVYYHDEIGVMLATALLVKALHRPVLPYLDITILGIGLFMACGRIGCLMVGCCHGRPCAWGIRYRPEHAEWGFPSYLIGMRLFPIQALESLWVFFVITLGAALIWRGQPPGTALAWYTVAYGAARFSFEFIRGDTDRPYTWGFSQGQWFSVWLITGMVLAEWSGRIPSHAWHAGILAGLLMVMLAVTVHRRLDPSQRFRILHPHHVCEVAAAMRAPETVMPTGKLSVCSIARVDCTSMGIRISRSRVEDGAGSADYYTLSRGGGALSRPAAMLLADLIHGLRRESRPARLVSGRFGAFHLMLPRDRQNGVAL
jgi:prolipoprotein diacylglyceryl transferase